MTSALEILSAERDALAAAIASNQNYLAVCLTEVAKVKREMAGNQTKLSELQAAIERIN